MYAIFYVRDIARSESEDLYYTTNQTIQEAIFLL